MTYERFAIKNNIRGVCSATYYVGEDSTALKINQTEFIGKYPSLGAAREVVNGYLNKNGCNDPWNISDGITENIVYVGANYNTQNSQTGNSVGTFYSKTAASGIVDTSNPLFIRLATNAGGTQYSRARIINEDDNYGGLIPNLWDSSEYRVSRYSASVQLETFNLQYWNSNFAVVGFAGSHTGAASTGTGLTIEKGCVFRPNSLGNWRCSWYVQTQTADTSRLYEEQAFFDTSVNAFNQNNLSILINNNGGNATWIINDKPVWFLDPKVYNLKDAVSLLPITNVIYSSSSATSLNYVGVEVRRRITNEPQHSILIYNSKLETIV